MYDVCLGLLNTVVIALIAAKDEFRALYRGKFVIRFFCRLCLSFCCFGGHFVTLSLCLCLSLSLSQCRGLSASLLNSLGLCGFRSLG